MFIYKLIVLLLFLTSNLYAYLDPASGSMLLTTLLSIIAGLYFFLKSFYYKIINIFTSLFGKKIIMKRKDLIIFSEGEQYWLTFKPLIEELLKKEISITYISMDKNDSGLNSKHKLLSVEYIGKGNKAYAYLSILEAKVVISTTLGLDVLQIKKSKGVNHYIHIIHAPSSLYKCKLYSFDYYDSIFISGQHQIDNIRYLEKTRDTNKKELYKIGCLYYDEMSKQIPQKIESNGLKILIAPSWDKNGLLNLYGSKLIFSLLEVATEIIIRPHPQSYISEQSMLNKIKDDLKNKPNIKWDKKTSPIAAMNECDIMISDYSSVTIDYLFLFKKPLVVMNFEINHLGSEGEDLKEGNLEHWEINILKKVAEVCNNIELLPKIIQNMHSNAKSLEEDINSIIESSIYNFAEAREPAGKKVIEILKRYE